MNKFEVEYATLHADVFIANVGTLGKTLTDSRLEGMKLFCDTTTLSLIVEYAGREIHVPAANVICMVKKRS